MNRRSLFRWLFGGVAAALGLGVASKAAVAPTIHRQPAMFFPLMQTQGWKNVVDRAVCRIVRNYTAQDAATTLHFERWQR